MTTPRFERTGDLIGDSTPRPHRTRERSRDASAGAVHTPWLAALAAALAIALGAVVVLRPAARPAAVTPAQQVGPATDARGPGASAPPVAKVAVEPARSPIPAAAESDRRREDQPDTARASILGRADELAALAVMELIADTQRAFAASRQVDADCDAIGEHGYLLELMGQVHRGRQDGAPAVGLFDPWRLARVFGGVVRGVAKADGYLFRVYLPGENGTPLEEAPNGGPGALQPDPDRAETAWSCYAWPAAVENGETGGAFFVDQTGAVLVADNTRGAYVGVAGGPAAGAALRFDAAGTVGAPSAADGPDGLGRDGQVWRRAVPPTESTMTVEIVDATGHPVPEVVVSISSQSPSRRLDDADISTQREVLANTPLVVSGAALEKTDQDGRVSLRGRAVSGCVVVLGVGHALCVPTRLRAEDGVLRIELPPSVELVIAPQKNANESAAIATLKNISSAQAQCQASAVIDANGNGAGEYGYFAELAGACFLRGAAGPTDRKMSPPVLSAAFGMPPKDGEQAPTKIVVRSGYCFQMFLCDAGGFGLPESPAGGAGPLPPDPALAEVVWCCYAWPLVRGESGTRAFFANQMGDVFACENQTAFYSGLRLGPRPDAIFPPDSGGKIVELLGPPAVATDGERWVVVN